MDDPGPRCSRHRWDALTRQWSPRIPIHPVLGVRSCLQARRGDGGGTGKKTDHRQPNHTRPLDSVNSAAALSFLPCPPDDGLPRPMAL